MSHLLTPELVAAPAKLPVELPEGKTHVRADHDDEDADIAAYLSTALSRIEGPDGITGLALITQTWRERGPCFLPGSLILALRPVQSITHIKYFDLDNVQQTLSGALYNDFLSGLRAFIALNDGETWPATFRRVDAIEVEYVAGFGDDAADVKPALKHAIKLLTGHYYANRESIIVGTIASDLPMGVMNLLRPFIRPHF